MNTEAVFKAMRLYNQQGSSKTEEDQNQSCGGGPGNTQLRKGEAAAKEVARKLRASQGQ